MIIRDDVERHGHFPGALCAREKGPQQLPHEEDVAGLPVPLAVREVHQPVVVRVNGAAVWAADPLGRAGRSRAEYGR